MSYESEEIHRHGWIQDIIKNFSHECEQSSGGKLQFLYVEIIREIFGVGERPSFKMHDMQYSVNPLDYDALFKFLHPMGPLFKICYKLLLDGCYYDFPVSDMPAHVQKEIKSKPCPQFYSCMIKQDSVAMDDIVLLLNPFEFYMFYFVGYLLKSDAKSNNKYYIADEFELKQFLPKATLYLRLCEEYLTFFLPCDNTPVLPLLPLQLFSRIQGSLSAQNMGNTPQSILRLYLLNKAIDPSLESNISPGKTVEDLWRSYVLANITIDFWIIKYSDRLLDDYESGLSLPSLDNVCVVRYLLKHLHTFLNRDCHPKLDEFKRLIAHLFQLRVYNFLKTVFERWPHDSSFIVVLETWLTYIQPWRYIVSTADIKNDYYDRTSTAYLDSKWQTFIGDNFLFYTHIFEIFLRRFKNCNFAMIKTCVLLLRPLKVYNKFGLASKIKELEHAYMNETSLNLSGENKICDNIRQHINTVESNDFVYRGLFSYEVKQEVKCIAKVVQSQTSFLTFQNNNKLWRFIRRTIFSGIDYFIYILVSYIIPYNIPVNVWTRTANPLHRKKDTAFELLSSIFELDTDITITLENEALNGRRLSIEGLDVRSRKLRLMLNKSVYRGDPDLQLVRSFENITLVRLFFKLSSWVNFNYGQLLQREYCKESFSGRLTRMVLQPPLEIVTIDKNRGINGSEYVKSTLPPRLSLRYFAQTDLYVHLGIATFFSFVFGFSLVQISLFFIIIYYIFSVFNSYYQFH